MRILNLYAGIGGNRKLWGDKHEVTAIENNSLVAKGSIGSMNGKHKKNWYAKKNLDERNMVNPKLGLHILNYAFKKEQTTF